MNIIPRTDFPAFPMTAGFPSAEKGIESIDEAGTTLAGMFFNLLTQEINPGETAVQSPADPTAIIIESDQKMAVGDGTVLPLPAKAAVLLTDPAVISGQPDIPEPAMEILSRSDSTAGAENKISIGQKVRPNIGLADAVANIKDVMVNSRLLNQPFDPRTIISEDRSGNLNMGKTGTATEGDAIGTPAAVSTPIWADDFESGFTRDAISGLFGETGPTENPGEKKLSLNISRAILRPEDKWSEDIQNINGTISKLTSALNIKEAEVLNKITDGKLVVEGSNQKGVLYFRPELPEEKKLSEVSLKAPVKAGVQIRSEEPVTPVDEAAAPAGVKLAGENPMYRDPVAEGENKLQNNGRAAATPQATSGLELSAESNSKAAGSVLPSDGGETAVKADPAAVKFHLPEDLGRSAVRGTQTVTIRMEPETLGSVRLTLTNHQDIISGRLLVDSHAARTAIQANLDVLHEQLAQHGIKLASFDVALSGGEAGYRFSQGKTDRGNRLNQINRREIVNDQPVVSGAGVSSAAKMYIGATGVNWVV